MGAGATFRTHYPVRRRARDGIGHETKEYARTCKGASWDRDFFHLLLRIVRREAGNSSPSPRLRSRRARTQAGRSFDEITGRWRHARRHASIQTGLAKRKDCIWSALRPRLPSQMRLPGVFHPSTSISTSRRSTGKSNAKFYLSDWVQHAAGALYTMQWQRCVPESRAVAR